MSKDKPDASSSSTFRSIVKQGLQSAQQIISQKQPAKPGPCEQEPASDMRRDSSITDSEQLKEAQEALRIIEKSLASVATAVWRAKRKLGEELDTGLPKELRHLPRHIDAAWDALTDARVEVDDPTGRRYVPGMAVHILTIQPLPDATCEIIHETLKPSVFINGVLKQHADVILGRPESDSGLSSSLESSEPDSATGADDATPPQGQDQDEPHDN